MHNEGECVRHMQRAQCMKTECVQKIQTNRIPKPVLYWFTVSGDKYYAFSALDANFQCMPVQQN